MDRDARLRMSPGPEPLRPVGPGREGANAGAHPEPCPPFESDPIGWFEWVDKALAAGRPLEPAARPSTWTDTSGCHWRVLATTDGPEIRPSFGGPYMETRGQPLISALLVSQRRLLVELTWRDGREVVEAAPGEVACRDLGLAMLTGTELPHEAVQRVGRDTWDRAVARWHEPREASRQDGRPSSSAPEDAGDSQPRPSWPVSAR